MNDDEYLEWQKKQQNRRRKMTRHERQAARRFYLGWLAVVLLIVLFVLLLSTTARSAAMPSQIAQEPAFHAPVNTTNNAFPPDMPAMEAEAKKEADDGLPLDYLGRFTVTHYCPCAECCGKSETDPWRGITATGTIAIEGRTIAVDPAVIPHGSRVALFYDDGRIVEYIAEDSGVYGNSVDVFVDDHERAAKLGITAACVYLVREE